MLRMFLPVLPLMAAADVVLLELVILPNVAAWIRIVVHILALYGVLWMILGTFDGAGQGAIAAGDEADDQLRRRAEGGWALGSVEDTEAAGCARAEIDEAAAGFQEWYCRFDNSPLNLVHSRKILRGKSPTDVGAPADYAGVCAGSIHQNRRASVPDRISSTAFNVRVVKTIV